MKDGLELTPEEMRAYGYRVIDCIVEHLSTLQTQPVGRKADPAILTRPRESFAEEGTAFEALLERVQADVLSNTMHVNHPRFFAYVPGPGNFVGAMADALTSAYNVFAGTWVSGSGAAAVELETVNWLRELCGFPETTGGLFVSGGTLANLTALAVARDVKLGEEFGNATIYFSDQTHSSIEKVLKVLGFAGRQLRKLQSDAAFRLPVDLLRDEVMADRARGMRPFCVIANAGTTNTGAVDALAKIAEFCQVEDLWMHVDGAYGAAAAICDRGKALLGGLELADSLSLDPHKWLFQPFECGCVLVRDGSHLTKAFRILPEYLKDTQVKSAEVNLTDQGIQLTRSFRALKLWLSLRTFGVAAFRRAVERGFWLAERFEAELRARPDWEVVSPAQMGILCFRYRGAGEAFHLDLVQRILADGYALVTSTRLGGETMLRACPINPRTTEEDIVETVRRVDRMAQG